MIARHLLIRGRVQGVGYREWAMRTAQSRGLTGWVRNRADGSVEALVCGNGSAVEGFVEACRNGPSLARVDAVDCREQDMAAEEGFTIRPTL